MTTWQLAVTAIAFATMNKQYLLDWKFQPTQTSADRSPITMRNVHGTRQYDLWCGYGTDLFRIGSTSAILEVERREVPWRASDSQPPRCFLHFFLVLTEAGKFGGQILEMFGFAGAQAKLDVFQLAGPELEFKTVWSVGDLSSPALYFGQGSVDTAIVDLLVQLWSPDNLGGKKVGDSWEIEVPGLSGSADGSTATVFKYKYSEIGVMNGEPAAKMSFTISAKDPGQKWVCRATQYLNPRTGILTRFDGRFHDGKGSRVALALRLRPTRMQTERADLGSKRSTANRAKCPN